MAAALTVVIAPGPAPALDLRGPLDPDALEAALAALPPSAHTLHRHSATHHTLRLESGDCPAGALADLLTAPPPQTPAAADAAVPAAAARDDAAGLPAEHPLPAHGTASRGAGAGAGTAAVGAAGAAGAFGVAGVASAGTATAGAGAAAARAGRGRAAAVPPAGLPAAPRQREVLLDALTARSGAAPLHVEQLHWRWYGPLDTRRFRDAWRAVAAQEPVLRAAFAEHAADSAAAGPCVVVHPEAAPDPVRHPYGSADWHSLLVGERLRPFDLHRPGPLRIALLDEQAGPAGPTRVILTFHHALLDGWSVRLLLRSFYRAYLAAGRTHGGERRPDVRDHLDWLARQDDTAPRAYWARAVPPADSRTLPPTAAAAVAARGDRPARTGPARTGHGRARIRLTPGEAVRLREWAARHGAAESTALGAAWALLLHRGTGSGFRPSPVAFAVAASGRGITLRGAAGLPAPLQGPLPLHVRVDPSAPVVRLLADLAGATLGASSYEWVSHGQIHTWSGRGADSELTASLLAFDPPAGPPFHPGPPAAVEAELAEEGVQLGRPQAVDAYTALPISIRAHHDCEGGLVLTAVNDRTRIPDAEAEAALAQTALLLRELPADTDGTTPARQFLRLLAEAAGPATPAAPPAARGTGLVELRSAAHPGAGTVLLVPPPGATADCYAGVADAYRGPQALATVPPPADAAACLRALRPALAAGEPLLLGGHSGGGQLAYEIARRIGAHGWRPPPVAVAASARGLARTLRTAAPPTDGD
ncbi:condensation domain-containing protein [Streptomyces sp. 2P-4]|uniref:condensation domain-containing protein n=1 Tax=Streptomyces sp. 2P-4 TaxID=2931974 RepID=UPI0025403E79|nr:condensation domain-containing protein [Streptomyces sp. 2P-4]